MNTYRLAILIACCTLLAHGSYACEIHQGFGGGAFGSKWQPYDPNGEYESYSDTSTESSSSETKKKARPVFSSTAQTSSDSAKKKLADRKTDEESNDQNSEKD